MKATLKFANREQAKQFTQNWERYSKRGHNLGSGLINVEVSVFDVTEKDKNWIDNYVNNINS